MEKESISERSGNDPGTTSPLARSPEALKMERAQRTMSAGSTEGKQSPEAATSNKDASSVSSSEGQLSPNGHGASPNGHLNGKNGEDAHEVSSDEEAEPMISSMETLSVQDEEEEQNKETESLEALQSGDSSVQVSELTASSSEESVAKDLTNDEHELESHGSPKCASQHHGSPGKELQTISQSSQTKRSPTFALLSAGSSEQKLLEQRSPEQKSLDQLPESEHYPMQESHKDSQRSMSPSQNQESQGFRSVRPKTSIVLQRSKRRKTPRQKSPIVLHRSPSQESPGQGSDEEPVRERSLTYTLTDEEELRNSVKMCLKGPPMLPGYTPPASPGSGSPSVSPVLTSSRDVSPKESPCRSSPMRAVSSFEGGSSLLGSGSPALGGGPPISPNPTARGSPVGEMTTSFLSKSSSRDSLSLDLPSGGATASAPGSILDMNAYNEILSREESDAIISRAESFWSYSSQQDYDSFQERLLGDLLPEEVEQYEYFISLYTDNIYTDREFKRSIVILFNGNVGLAERFNRIVPKELQISTDEISLHVTQGDPWRREPPPPLEDDPLPSLRLHRISQPLEVEVDSAVDWGLTAPNTADPHVDWPDDPAILSMSTNTVTEPLELEDATNWLGGGARPKEPSRASMGAEGGGAVGWEEEGAVGGVQAPMTSPQSFRDPDGRAQLITDEFLKKAYKKLGDKPGAFSTFNATLGDVQRQIRNGDRTFVDVASGTTTFILELLAGHEDLINEFMHKMEIILTLSMPESQ